MVDMSNFIAPKSDQINADDLIGGPRTITIARVTGNEGNAEQPVNVFFEEHDLPFRPCKSMRRVMVAVWGADASKYVGKSMTIFRDPKVKWGGMEVGGIRISHMSDLDAPKQMALTETRAKRTPYKVLPLKDAPAPKTDEAGEYAAKFIANCGRAPSREKLEQYITQTADKRGELADNLQADCDKAITEARNRLPETASEEDPFATEGAD